MSADNGDGRWLRSDDRMRVVVYREDSCQVIGARSEIGHFIDIGGERIIVHRVRFTGGVVCVEARVYRDV